MNKVKAFENVLPSKIFDYGSFNKPILAGVSGTAKKFLKENLDGVYIFPPDNYSIAIKKIKQIRNDEKKEIDNSNFVKLFSRSNIMKEMVESIFIELAYE